MLKCVNIVLSIFFNVSIPPGNIFQIYLLYIYLLSWGNMSTSKVAKFIIATIKVCRDVYLGAFVENRVNIGHCRLREGSIGWEGGGGGGVRKVRRN